ncbi:MAG: helix-turn-helix domain-containing protein [Bacteroidetes bacterium]|nr:helix-turn-helix domain-containing protein [Bacteroidota bacterium]
MTTVKFETYYPTERLKPYIKQYIVSESMLENQYKVFPSTGLVIGFQYKGSLTSITNESSTNLHAAGITGITDGYKTFRNSVNIGTILVYFTETGFTSFATLPSYELFNLSISLEEVFDKYCIRDVEEKLSFTNTDGQRIKIIEHFLISQLREIESDRLIVEAVKLIYQSKGAIRIKELNEKLFISQSPFEKRFRKIAGTSPKKFASIVRFNTVLNSLGNNKSLTERCYENNFFDQAHFIKDFKQYTSDTPENFKRFL